MFLNLFIVLFIIGIAYWQGLQGFFSAFLHLVLVIVAGTLAFAFWEPVAMGMLSGMMPRFAWAVGLFMPFIFFLLVLRVLMDKMVPANVDFSQLTNLLAGGVCGAIAAAITAGVFVISISFLPGAKDNFGYQPYAVSPDTGHVVKSDSGGLWIPVDTLAANIFTTLSNGSFAPANGKSLATEQPDFLRRAHYNRLRPDANSSTVATPGSVEITLEENKNDSNYGKQRVFSYALPTDKLPDILIENLPSPKVGEPDIAALLKDEKQRLVIVETKWTNLNSNFDPDRLRVYPQQVQLVTNEKGGPLNPVVRLPFAVSRQTKREPDEREFHVVNRAGVEIASEATDATTLAFLFIVPVNHVEQYLLVRNLRLPITPAMLDPKPTAEATEKVMAVVGTSIAKGPETAATTDTKTSTVGPTTGGKVGVKAEDVTLSAELPMMTSKNLLGDIGNNNRNEITGGTGSVGRPNGPISRANQVTHFHVPEQQAMVRVKLAKQVAFSYLAQAQAAAGALNAMFITDNEGNQWFPSGYVWHQKGASTRSSRSAR